MNLHISLVTGYEVTACGLKSPECHVFNTFSLGLRSPPHEYWKHVMNRCTCQDCLYAIDNILNDVGLDTYRNIMTIGGLNG
jgi:hypothetical protein